MSTLRTALFLLAAAAVALLPMQSASAAEPEVLTIVGKVGLTNREPFDPFRDAFLKFRDKKFDKAFAFTREALAKLPQATVTARADGWPSEIKATGPHLAEVLKAAGVAPDAKIRVTAFDGYNIEFNAAERAAKDWILAIDVDGKPLSLGGRGPVWLIHDTGGATVKADAEAPWVWSLFLIEVL